MATRSTPANLLRVATPDGVGTVLLVTADGYLAVRIDGETTTHYWLPSQCTAVA